MISAWVSWNEGTKTCVHVDYIHVANVNSENYIWTPNFKKLYNEGDTIFPWKTNDVSLFAKISSPLRVQTVTPWTTK